MTRLAALLLLLSSTLAAQSPSSVERAVSSIRAEEVRRRIGILADDSMRGRDTPSPELEKVASWIAAEFQRFGLRPGGPDGAYMQRYLILRLQVDAAATFATVSRPGSPPLRLAAGGDLRVLQLGPPLPSRAVTGAIVLLAGRADSAADPLAQGDVRGTWVAMCGARGSIDARTARAALSAGAVGLLVISDRTEPEWQARAARDYQPTVTLGADSGPDAAPGLVEIREQTATRVLGVAPGMCGDEQPRRARRLLGVSLTLQVHQRILSSSSAPNVIGILEGSDPALKNEYVFFTAHMDHLGVASPQNRACEARGSDSICNGADDDASGTAAVIENAAAFSKLAPHPKRSLVFMTVSGEEKGLWGSDYFTTHPTVPPRAIVADLNTDMVGRNWKDTIAVIGKEQSDLGTTLDRVAAAHPELHLTPIGDIWPSENFYYRSDHFNFARVGVPILFFFNGTHADYHQVSDEVSRIDAEKESRIIKLIFYLGLGIANGAQRPRWDPAAYKRVVEGDN